MAKADPFLVLELMVSNMCVILSILARCNGMLILLWTRSMKRMLGQSSQSHWVNGYKRIRFHGPSQRMQLTRLKQLTWLENRGILICSTELGCAFGGLDVSPKVRHFLWRLCSGILPVRSLLKYRHIADDDMFPLCQAALENVFHALSNAHMLLRLGSLLVSPSTYRRGMLLASWTHGRSGRWLMMVLWWSWVISLITCGFGIVRLFFRTC